MAASQQTNIKPSVGEKLEIALEFKEKGNSFYKDGNFKNAAKNYHKAILYLKVSNLWQNLNICPPNCSIIGQMFMLGTSTLVRNKKNVVIWQCYDYRRVGYLQCYNY